MTDASYKESILEYLNEESSILVLVLDRDGCIRTSNRYAEQLLDADLPNRAFMDIVVDFTGSVKWEDVLAESERVHLLNVKTGPGLPQTFYFRFLRAGSEILAIGEINSIELETLREGLVTANNELSNLGRELQKKNAELVKLNDLKNQFLGMATHDLRNPISIIHAYSNFLLEEIKDRLNGEHAEFLDRIRGSSEFMLHLLDDLLDIAKIESGKLLLHREPTDIESLIRHNVTLNGTLAQKKRIRIHFTNYELIPEIRVDRLKIDQVLNNLISNAVKFSPADTTVTVSVFKSGDHVTVSVRDEGPGISAEDKEKLFKPFSKTSVRPTGGEKSSGLGLSIVRKIVLGHLGKIWVESKAGQGANFCFSLPVTSTEKDSA